MNTYFDQFAYAIAKKHDGGIGIPEPIDPDLHQ
jgi:hypothetical protein